jgi:hypothetical protein
MTFRLCNDDQSHQARRRFTAHQKQEAIDLCLQ